MARSLIWSVAGVALLVGSLGWSSTAQAKALHQSPYSYKQTFGTALRLVKVDLNLDVSEIDAEWGYLRFVYTSRESGKRKNRGSFSFVKLNKTIQVALRLPEMPGYHEQLMMRKLKKKLQEEHGDPPKRSDEPEDDEPKDDEPEDDDGKDDAAKDERKRDDEKRNTKRKRRRRRQRARR